MSYDNAFKSTFGVLSAIGCAFVVGAVALMGSCSLLCGGCAVAVDKAARKADRAQRQSTGSQDVPGNVPEVVPEDEGENEDTTQGDPVNLTNFRRIETGDSLSRVADLLGSYGEELSRVELPGTPVTFMRMWKASGFMGGNCNVTFQGGKVVMKAQFGLKPGPASSLGESAEPVDESPEEYDELLPPGESRIDDPTPDIPIRPDPTPDPPYVSINLRTWSDTTGKFKIEAEFVSFAMGDVKLRKKDGTEITLPMKKLCEDDQKWIRAKGKR